MTDAGVTGGQRDHREAEVSITVRAAEPGEYVTIGSLTVDAYRADGQLDVEPSYEHDLRDVARRAADPHSHVLVATDRSGAVLGSVTLALPGSPYADLAGPGQAEFRMLAVDRAWQGRGVGELLVRVCCAQAGESGLHAMVIFVRDFSVRALRLYERLGFVRMPERDWTPVPGVNLLAMRLDLALLTAVAPM